MRMRSMPLPPCSGKRRRSLCDNRGADAERPDPRRAVTGGGPSCAAYPRQFRRNRGARRGLGAAGRSRRARAPLACALRRLRFSRSAAPQAALLGLLFPALRTIAHAAEICRPAPAVEGRNAASARAAALAPLAPLWQGSPRFAAAFRLRDFAPARRCRSSVVEHPLGKGEVVSSILTGSTIGSTT